MPSTARRVQPRGEKYRSPSHYHLGGLQHELRFVT